MPWSRRQFLAAVAAAGVGAACAPAKTRTRPERRRDPSLGAPPEKTAPPPTAPPGEGPLVLGAGGSTRLVVDGRTTLRTIAPGAVGYGAMWKRDQLWPTPPSSLDDTTHRAFIDQLADANRPLLAEAGARHLSWPWGVSFTTFGVNWERSVGPLSTRTPDQAPGSGWNEVAVVGVDDLVDLADAWELEALTIGAPLAVWDGPSLRWGPAWPSFTFDAATIATAADHAVRMVDHIAAHDAWGRISRLFVPMGCEWRPFASTDLDEAARSYAALVRRVRDLVADDKVVVVACAADSADFGGINLVKANAWNRPLHEELADLDGVAFDLHKYRDAAYEAGPGGTAAMTDANVDALMGIAERQRDWLAVDPAQWGGSGDPLPSMLAEISVKGLLGELDTSSTDDWPWPAAPAQADLVREVVASDALAALTWTWYPESIPAEWPHGALRAGTLSRHARAIGFVTQRMRGELLDSSASGAPGPRLHATRDGDAVFAVGGNFSRSPARLTVETDGVAVELPALVETLGADGPAARAWDGSAPLDVAPLTLVRIRLA